MPKYGFGDLKIVRINKKAGGGREVKKQREMRTLCTHPLLEVTEEAWKAIPKRR